MAEYLFLIFETEADWVDGDEQAWRQTMQQHEAFSAYVRDNGGKVLGGEALQPVATATSVRGDVVTDGPWAELKEQFGGYYVIDAPDLDAAIDFAKRCPAGRGGIEVRPLLDTSGGPEALAR